ncbi:isoaspartyl peptidase/L-asparaginase family protein [Kibdelosporangium aridum]|uniref:Beta-aspartyl-peptidase (Threonine type) n=1 Tax=Kibdelosporangium aridum TaxID=2030 RepID=A0A1Y5XPG0_KIBAR|nr:isoaspartyl peptidase/L-asparaginase [Kibdelosporangium aridum]SMD09762.1 beta-aspartyl-peptidase (threonine type) [Kibdelosporangium aridum]
MRFLLAFITTAGLLLAVQHSGAEPVHTGQVETNAHPKPDARNVILAVHGGAGTGLIRKDTPPELEKAYRDGLAAALRAGEQVLRGGGASLDAVEAAVKVLEDNELFNAGKGAVFTEDAGHELDASIMRGDDLRAGAVAGVKSVKNPISAARLVMEKSPHVLLAGEGADDFAARNGLKTVTQDYFWTQRRWDQLMNAKNPQAPKVAEYSTVGAVAVDQGRNLSAATSTGGLTNKMIGRVGDSPVIGAGTYAKNETAAISATGQGEVFIRGAAASTISNMIEFGRKSLADAAFEVIVKRLPALGGTGGVIALDRQGTFDAPHSTPGMLHGYLTADGKIVTKVFVDETPSNS